MRYILSFGLSVFLLSAAASTVRAEEDFAEVVMVRGKATARLKDSRTFFLSPAAKLPEGAQVATGRGAIVRFKLKDGSSLLLGSESSLVLKESEAELGTLNLDWGFLRALVLKKKAEDEKEKLIVTTKTAAMGIRGTEFCVHFDPEGERTTLSTLEGRVAMAALDKDGQPEQVLRGPAQMVGAGDYLSLTSGAGALPRAPEKIPAPLLEHLKKEGESFPAWRSGLLRPQSFLEAQRQGGMRPGGQAGLAGRESRMLKTPPPADAQHPRGFEKRRGPEAKGPRPPLRPGMGPAPTGTDPLIKDPGIISPNTNAPPPQ